MASLVVRTQNGTERLDRRLGIVAVDVEAGDPAGGEVLQALRAAVEALAAAQPRS